MFQVTKNARMHERYAKEHYRTADLAACVEQKLIEKLPGKDGWWYCTEFTTHVIGCGDTVPKDHNPDDRTRFTVEASYSTEELLEDTMKLSEVYGAPRIAKIINGGLDLDIRGEAWDGKIAKLSKKGLNTAEKFLWVAVNRKDLFQAGDPAEMVKVYDKLNPANGG